MNTCGAGGMKRPDTLNASDAKHSELSRSSNVFSMFCMLQLRLDAFGHINLSTVAASYPTEAGRFGLWKSPVERSFDDGLACGPKRIKLKLWSLVVGHSRRELSEIWENPDL